MEDAMWEKLTTIIFVIGIIIVLLIFLTLVLTHALVTN